jgi:serine/threonine protein kinase
MFDLKHFPLKNKKRYPNPTLVGSGSYGNVYIANDKKRKETVVIKDYKTRPKHGQYGLDYSATREILILNQLKNHKNILPLYDVYCAPTEVSVVMKYGGTSLKKFIKSKSLDSETNLSIAHQLLSAVAYCHKNQVIHRDIKPDNTLYDENTGVVSLIDFGMAKKMVHDLPLSGYQVRTNFYVVTQYYRAPEIFLNQEYSVAVDVWSVGCVIFELYANETLFRYNETDEMIEQLVGFTPTATLKAVLNDRFGYVIPKYDAKRKLKKLSTTHPLVYDLLDKMLQFDPNKRITASEALKHPLFENL